MEVGGGHCVALGGDDGTEGFVLHRLPTHKGDVVGRGVVPLVVIAMGVGKVGVLHAQLACPLIHQGHKVVHTAGDRLGQNIAGLIGGGGEGAVENVLQPGSVPPP